MPQSRRPFNTTCKPLFSRGRHTFARPAGTSQSVPPSTAASLGPQPSQRNASVRAGPTVGQIFEATLTPPKPIAGITMWRRSKADCNTAMYDSGRQSLKEDLIKIAKGRPNGKTSRTVARFSITAIERQIDGNSGAVRQIVAVEWSQVG